MLNKIYHRDFRIFKGLAKDSIDLIFTDPPYGKEGIPLYSEVAKLANYVLKPKGFCIVYASSYWLAETFPGMLNWLDYWYLYHHINRRRTPQCFPRMLWSRAKALIVFAKDRSKAKPQKWHNNCFAAADWEKSNRQDNWQQTVAEAKFYIENFCPPRGLVLDPMCGSGTTCVAAKQIDRNYIGIDIDKQSCRMSKKRIKAL
jgi:site-specific DNA-methyltransferase (adenine-specific)